MNTSKQHLHIRILRIHSHELDGMIASAVVVLAFTSRFTPCKKKVVGFDCAMEYFYLKGQMHQHDDLGSKCAYTCHLSNKTTRKSVLLSTPQIWLMKVSKKLA